MRWVSLLALSLTACAPNWGQLGTAHATGSYSSLSECSCDITRDSSNRLDTLSVNCWHGPSDLTLTWQLHAPTPNEPGKLDASNMIINAISELGIVWGVGTGSMELTDPPAHRTTLENGNYFDYFTLTSHLEMKEQKFCSPIRDPCTGPHPAGSVDVEGTCQAALIIN